MTSNIEQVRFGELVTPMGEAGPEGSFWNPAEPVSWKWRGESFTFDPAHIAQTEEGSLIKIETDGGPGYVYYEVLGNRSDESGITSMVRRLMPDEAQKAIVRLGLNPEQIELVAGVPVNKP